MFEQDCNHSKQCRNNVATRCCDKNRRCDSSRVTPPSVAGKSYQMLEVLAFWNSAVEDSTFFNDDSSANFSVEKSTMKNSGVSIF